jgi:hypothetical protein
VAYETLVRVLTGYPSGAGSFNQYADTDPDLDRPDGAAARRRNLLAYLDAFVDARYVLVGEAAGFAGCRFSGIPFTCEAQLSGPDALGWTLGQVLSRSGSAGTPWVERSATMVWETLGERRDCLLWNAFPWHPFGPGNPLSNRPPGVDVKAGLAALQCLLGLFAEAQPVAIGRVAERALAAIGRETTYIRHPSRGGKRKFVQGIGELLGPGT